MSYGLQNRMNHNQTFLAMVVTERMIDENYDFKTSKRNRATLDIEERLNYLTQNDPHNEEIYHLLKKLAETYIQQNKYVYGYSGIDDVAHDVAADVWMAVLNGRKIYAWQFYIGKMIKTSYVTKQKQLEHEIIDTTGDPDLEENVINMCAGSSISNIKDFDEMLSGLMLDNVSALIADTMKDTKFREGTSEYRQVYTNVCINLVRELDNEKPIYFRIDEALEPYVQLVIAQFKEKFRDSGFADSIMEYADDRQSLIEDLEEARRLKEQ